MTLFAKYMTKFNNKSLTLAYIGIIFSELFWAASFIFTKEALSHYSPFSVVVMRITIATLILFLFCGIRHELDRPTRKEWLLFTIAGIFQPFIYFILEAYGLQITQNPNTASLVLALGPLLSPFIAWLLIREQVTIYTFIGLFVSTTGIAIIVLIGQNLNFNPLGVTLLGLAAITTVLYCICLRKIDARFKPATIVFYIDLTSLMFFIPTWLIFDHSRNIITPSFTPLVSIFILAVFCSVVSYIFFCNAVRFIGVARANAFSNLIPALTPLCVWALDGEMISWNDYLGIFIVILGLFISQRKYT